MLRTLLLLPFLLVAPAAAQDVSRLAEVPRLPADTYVYSDLCVGTSVYDIRGHRVVLVLGPVIGNESASIEFSEFGADIGPLRSYLVLFEDAINTLDHRNTLEFLYQTQADEYTFQGTVYADRIVGVFDDDGALVTLPRVPTNSPIKPRCAN
jgi:hypothetical protein